MHLPDGIATVRQLRERGIRDPEIRTALRRGELRRVRPGVVAAPACDTETLEAARLGGRLAGASAARRHGLWVPVDTRLCVEVPRGAHVPAHRVRVIRGPPVPPGTA